MVWIFFCFVVCWYLGWYFVCCCGVWVDYFVFGGVVVELGLVCVVFGFVCVYFVCVFYLDVIV